MNAQKITQHNVITRLPSPMFTNFTESELRQYALYCG